MVAHLATEKLSAEEGWVADDVVGFGPDGFVGGSFFGVAEDGVGVFGYW